MTDPVRDALSAEAYERAFNKVSSGNEMDLTDEERDALRTAREVTNTQGPGAPMPWRLDPTRDLDS